MKSDGKKFSKINSFYFPLSALNHNATSSAESNKRIEKKEEKSLTKIWKKSFPDFCEF